MSIKKDKGVKVSRSFFRNLYSYLICLLIMQPLTTTISLAEGSGNLYPTGAQGYRAFLHSSTSANNSYPFPTRGTHYVYARAGETITLASSTLGKWKGKIELYNPLGNLVVNSDASTNGLILNRTAELAGPQIPDQFIANRYTPITYTVPNGADGIYKVEFFPAKDSKGVQDTIQANADWVQTKMTGIIAWDISVINKSGNKFIPGRVYANVLVLRMSDQDPPDVGFYGIVYILTKDGYIYKVNNNGNNGLGFSFFVNNNGFIDSNGSPVYQSLNNSKRSFLNGKVHDPRTADTHKQITQKIFYTLPAVDLPPSAKGGPVQGDSTWLKNEPSPVPKATNLRITGIGGTPGQASERGSYITFDVNVESNYNILIESADASSSFTPRALTGHVVAGHNKIFWDGIDGNGDPLSEGSHQIKVTLKFHGAEVHFPFFDVEYNKHGIIIELLDPNDLSTPYSDLIYWDDSKITFTSHNGSTPNPIRNSHLPPTNSHGISSNTNGHIWAIGATGGGSDRQFGDNKSIDTWTFIERPEKINIAPLSIKKADLKVSSFVPDTNFVTIGGVVSVTAKVKNDGPSDVKGAPFSFVVPPGFDFKDASFSDGCGSESGAGAYNPASGRYEDTLDLPNGCEITYNLKLMATEAATPGDVSLEATILRPKDLTDPDATNTDPFTPPTDPHYECEHNGQGGSCNNIKSSTISFKPTSDLKVTETINNMTPYVGDTVTLTIGIENNGPHNATDVEVKNILPSGYIYLGNTATIKNYNNSTHLWTIGALKKGRKDTLRIKAVIESTGSYFDSSRIMSPEIYDPNPSNNLSIVNPTPKPLSDIKVTKTVDKPNPYIGVDVVFKIVVANLGPSNATGVEVTDLLPSGYTYSSDTPSSGTSYDNVSGRWNIGSLANGSDALLKIVAKVNLTGDFKNRAVGKSNNDDPDPSNDSSTATVTPLHRADLEIKKRLANKKYQINDIYVADYEIIATNNGPQDATNVVVTDEIPKVLENAENISTQIGSTDYNTANRTLTWVIDSLAAGKSSTLTFSGKVTGFGPLSNTAKIKAEEQDDNMGNNTSTTPSLPFRGKELLVPTAFSPNGDGQNDIFRPFFRRQVQDYELQIYDRWGQLLFTSRDPGKGWDGTSHNKSCGIGAYIWSIRYRQQSNGTLIVDKGTITLVR